jgi:hypothetical protein
MPFQWSDRVDEATWWTDVLHPFARDVGSVIPAVFPAYARVLHPVVDHGTRRRWADLAAENGRVMHPEVQLHEISRAPGEPRPDGYTMDRRVEWGSLPRPELDILGGLLARATTTPERSWCCVWEGYAQIHRDAAAAPRDEGAGSCVAVPGRAYHLLCGPLTDLPDLFERLGQQSPNIWWPDDRAWCVSTEVDLAWTYVAADAATIDAVLADPRLETVRAEPTERFSWESDLVNRALDAPE